MQWFLFYLTPKSLVWRAKPGIFSLLEESYFSEGGIRQIIQNFLRDDEGRPRGDLVDNVGIVENKYWDPVFIVRARPAARYRHFINSVGKLSILGVKKTASGRLGKLIV